MHLLFNLVFLTTSSFVVRNLAYHCIMIHTDDQLGSWGQFNQQLHAVGTVQVKGQSSSACHDLSRLI